MLCRLFLALIGMSACAMAQAQFRSVDCPERILLKDPQAQCVVRNNFTFLVYGSTEVPTSGPVYKIIEPAIAKAPYELSIAKITGWGIHYGGKVQYGYQVQNFSTSNIKRLTIGIGADEKNSTRELKVGPEQDAGTTSFWIPTRIAARPDGWDVSYSYEDESAEFALEWIEGNYRKKLWPNDPDTANTPAVKSNSIGIPSGAIWDNFSVTLPKADPGYINCHVWVSTEENFQIIKISKGDTLPPTLELITHRVGNPGQHQGWEAFDIEAKTSDNHDPNPELRLEPVEPSKSGDIKIDYAHGKWQVRFKNHPGNRYQLRFIAEDATGNKTSKTFDYVVPRSGSGQKNSGPK
jgi:hypothetical protein